MHYWFEVLTTIIIIKCYSLEVKTHIQDYWIDIPVHSVVIDNIKIHNRCKWSMYWIFSPIVKRNKICVRNRQVHKNVHVTSNLFIKQ